jgi:hypothetical protein
MALNAELVANGWTNELKRDLADECRLLASQIRAGDYKPEWGNAGLSRWMLDEVAASARDILTEHVYVASRALRALSEESTGG